MNFYFVLYFYEQIYNYMKKIKLQVQYRIGWLNYDETTWIDADKCSCDELIREFELTQLLHSIVGMYLGICYIIFYGQFFKYLITY